ncbi:MAG: acylphosphatase [Gemmatimonadales bacterium]
MTDGSGLPIRWTISGRVQRVGFRWFVMSQAERLGVVGWVANLPDGRVEVVGKGTAENLQLLEAALRRGPRIARVDHVEKGDFPHDIPIPNSFNIK